jgi:iron complex outermembrane receptor protein
VQAASSEQIFGHGNNFTIGLSIDRGLVQFSSTSELGTVNANQFPLVQGVGLFIDQPSGDLAPVGLGAATLYTGLYATDTFDVTSRFSITAGGRLNFAQINLTDGLGNAPELSGNHSYTHFNPMVGGTYKLTPNLSVYGDFAVPNRVFIDLADGSCITDCAIANASGPPLIPNVAVKFNESIVRGGINYRFSL